jgi:hypothetical protein
MKTFYFIGVIIITLFMIAYYIYKERDHASELKKIERLEKMMIEEEEKLDKIRSTTIPCPVPHLKTPRTCYINSNYRCSWNEQAKRCDQK